MHIWTSEDRVFCGLNYTVANDNLYFEYRLKVRKKLCEIYFCKAYHCDADLDVLFTFTHFLSYDLNFSDKSLFCNS